MKTAASTGPPPGRLFTQSPPGESPPPTPAGSTLRLVCLALLALHLGLSPLLFSVSTHEAFEFPKLLLLIATCAIVGTLVLSRPTGALGTRSPAEGHRRGWRDPVVVGLAWLAVSGLVSTASSVSVWTSLAGEENSFAGLPTLLAYVVLFSLTRGLIRTTGEARRLLAAAALGAAMASAHALLQILGHDPIPWTRAATLGKEVRPFGTLGHPNFLAGYLAMALPLTIYFADRAWAARRRGAALCLGLCGLLAALLIVLSASRGAWLAGLAVLAVAGLRAAGRASPRTGIGLVAGVATAGLLLVGVYAMAPRTRPLFDGLKHRAVHITDSPSRLHIWSAAFRIFGAHAVVGAGVDAFQIAFQRERRIEYWLTEWGATPQRAHNEWLHVLATQGLLGGTALTVCAFGLLRAGRHSWARAGRERRDLLAAVAAGVIAWAVQVTFSFTVVAVGGLLVTLAAVLAGPPDGDGSRECDTVPGWVHALTLATVALFGVTAVTWNLPPSVGAVVPLVLLGVATWVAASLVRLDCAIPNEHDDRSSSAASNSTPSPGRLALTGGLLLVVLAGGVVRPLQASVAARAGERLLASRPADALRLLERATEREPYRAVHWRTLARARLQVAALRQPPGEQRRLLEGAREAASRARDLVPASATSHAVLGTVLVPLARRYGDGRLRSEAMACFDRAVDLDPANPYLRVQAAGAARQLGHPGRARAWIAAALEILPDFGPALSERALLERDEGRLAEAIRWLERSVAGLHRDEHDLVDARANLASAYFAAGRLEEALPAARRASAMQESPDLRYNLGRILEAMGRTSEAEAEYGQALSLDPGHAPTRDAVARLRRTAYPGQHPPAGPPPGGPPPPEGQPAPQRPPSPE